MLAIVSSLAFAGASIDMSAYERACTVYCTGDILNTIQLSGIFNDSKTFVDMPMMYDPEDIHTAFDALTNKSNLTQLQGFLSDNFYEAGSDLDDWVPTDFQDTPSFLQSITNDDYREWAYEINQLWLVLGRQTNASVLQNPQRHSFVPIQYPMVVPGGRFRESYYWDSWWILRGLLICEMPDTAMNVLQILLDDVQNFGFVPNGNRIYYLDRSQPPMLSEMVVSMVEYYQWGSNETNALLIQAYPLLEIEYGWWMDMENGHVVELAASSPNQHPGILNRYHSNGSTPRPESYAEDVDEGSGASFWNEVRSGAETGWDFSSRFLADGYNMNTIDTTHIIPVELNSILYRYEQHMSSLLSYMLQQGIANTSTANYHTPVYYTQAAVNRSVALKQFCWNSPLNQYQDYNFTSLALSNNASSISNFIPMWAGLFDDESYQQKLASISALVSSGLLQEGGVLTTTLRSGQQWDSPNAWPPLVDLTIEGLARLNVPAAAALAANISNAWLTTGYLAFNSTGYMYEKYNAFKVGVGGGGGEYVPQIGFGWTNGVALVLLNSTWLLYDSIVVTDDDHESNTKKWEWILIGFGMVAVMIIGFLGFQVYHNDSSKIPVAAASLTSTSSPLVQQTNTNTSALCSTFPASDANMAEVDVVPMTPFMVETSPPPV